MTVMRWVGGSVISILVLVVGALQAHAQLAMHLLEYSVHQRKLQGQKGFVKGKCCPKRQMQIGPPVVLDRCWIFY